MSMNTLYLQTMQNEIQEKFKEIDERFIHVQETEINDYTRLLRLINDLQEDNERISQHYRKLKEDNFTLYNKIRGLTILSIVEGVIFAIVGIGLIII